MPTAYEFKKGIDESVIAEQEKRVKANNKLVDYKIKLDAEVFKFESKEEKKSEKRENISENITKKTKLGK